MRTGSPWFRSLILVLIGVLAGAGFGFILFWGFPGDTSSMVQIPGAESDAIEPGALVPVSGGNAAFGVQVGASAPDFVLSDLDGQEFRLSDLRGNVVLLNFWATWCGPCAVEMPLLESDYQEYRDQGFIVLAVNDGESAALVEEFGLEHGLSFPLLLDPGRVVQRLYQVRGYPSSIFVDQQGQIRFVHIGLIQENQLASYMEELGFGT